MSTPPSDPTPARVVSWVTPRDYALSGDQDPYTPWRTSPPLLLARELGTLGLLSEGRLPALPRVRNSGDRPRCRQEEHYRFENVYFELKAHWPDGPHLCFGGAGMHDATVRRIVRYGHDFNPLGRPGTEGMTKLAEAMSTTGQDISVRELIGGTRAIIPDDRPWPGSGVRPRADGTGLHHFLREAVQFTDDPNGVGTCCREGMRRVNALG